MTPAEMYSAALRMNYPQAQQRPRQPNMPVMDTMPRPYPAQPVAQPTPPMGGTTQVGTAPVQLPPGGGGIRPPGNPTWGDMAQAANTAVGARQAGMFPLRKPVQLPPGGGGIRPPANPTY